MKEKLNMLCGILGRYYKSNDEFLFRCPYCGHHKHKFSVNIEKNVYKCWICDARGKNIFRVIRKFGNFKQKEKWKELSGENKNLGDIGSLFDKVETSETVEEILKMPEGFRTLTKNYNSKSNKRALNYLISRDIGREEILKWKIGL